MAVRQIGVALIEDNRLVRDGIAALLDQVPDMQVVARASGANLKQLAEVAPRVVLLDLGLRNGASLRVAEKLRGELPDVRVILMDLLPAHEDVMEFVHLGVAGFIMKDATLDDLVLTIRSVAAGVDVLPPALTNSLFSQIAENAVATGHADSLEAARMTDRERQVINLIAEGLGNKQIAARLHISIHTVKSHVRNVMEKLALHSRLQIAAYMHQRAPKSSSE